MTAPTSMPRVGFDGSLSMFIAGPWSSATADLLHSMVKAAIRLLEGNPLECVASYGSHSTATEIGPDNPQGRPSRFPVREHHGHAGDLVQGGYVAWTYERLAQVLRATWSRSRGRSTPPRPR
jgi:hypothetical protein